MFSFTYADSPKCHSAVEEHTNHIPRGLRNMPSYRMKGMTPSSWGVCLPLQVGNKKPCQIGMGELKLMARIMKVPPYLNVSNTLPKLSSKKRIASSYSTFTLFSRLSRHLVRQKLQTLPITLIIELSLPYNVWYICH